MFNHELIPNMFIVDNSRSHFDIKNKRWT